MEESAGRQDLVRCHGVRQEPFLESPGIWKRPMSAGPLLASFFFDMAFPKRRASSTVLKVTLTPSAKIALKTHAYVLIKSFR